ncbi:MAG: DUF1211 domain-containing protein [Anaerolineae bacterium]|nr:DUF1211 domain-containing protein [Anaerolineae bacterium]
MSKERLLAFSDGVLAIIITIMVLELRPPEEPTFTALRPLAPSFFSYVLSFIFLGIYWNNHHHLFQVVEQVDGRTLWANLHLLFWLSLIPFVTDWIGASEFAAPAMALYGLALLLAATGYYILTRTLLALHNADSMLAMALGRDVKGKISVGIYLVAIPLAFIASWLAGVLYVAVAVLWLLPDRRIEEKLAKPDGH